MVKQMETYFIIKENTIEVHCVEKLISFSDIEFKLKIKENTFLLTGINLELLEIDQDAGKLIISGKLTTLTKVNKTPKEKESLLKRIFN